MSIPRKLINPISSEVSDRMASTRRRNTQPEVDLRSELHRLGLRFRIHRQLITGVRREVDIVFGPARVAVFVDGCFWHGCPQHMIYPKANADFWREKISTNIERDRDTNRRLRKDGWKVVRSWEHERPSLAARRIQRIVRSRLLQ